MPQTSSRTSSLRCDIGFLASYCAFILNLSFKAVVTVNLTALLVLVTLFISVSQSLPQTAYVKMVDVWLIFAQLVPWVEVCFDFWIFRSQKIFLGAVTHSDGGDSARGGSSEYQPPWQDHTGRS